MEVDTEAGTVGEGVTEEEAGTGTEGEEEAVDSGLRRLVASGGAASDRQEAMEGEVVVQDMGEGEVDTRTRRTVVYPLPLLPQPILCITRRGHDSSGVVFLAEADVVDLVDCS